MKKIIIGSYYQFESLDKDTRPKIVQIVNDIIDKEGTMLVSKANYEKAFEAAEHLKEDYLLALACDIEVAIQEKKLIDFANAFGFEYSFNEYCKRPKVIYGDDFSPLELKLAPDDLVDGVVYVINTHGKQQKIDGSLGPMVMNMGGAERIVVDACSSASHSFPHKHSGNKSALEIIAQKIAQKNISLSKEVEMVGYKDKFTINDTHLTEYAVFAKREKVKEQSRLQISTIAELSSRSVAISQNYKENLSSLTNPLLSLLKDVCGKYTSTFVTKNFILADANPEVITFLLKVAGREDNQTVIDLKTDLNCNEDKPANIIRAFITKIGKERNVYLNQCSTAEINDIAEQVMRLDNKNLTPDPSSKKNTFADLQEAIEKLKQARDYVMTPSMTT